MSKLIQFTKDSEYNEVADSIGDGLTVIQAVENAMQDGFQLTDLFVALASEDEVREIINDGPVFVAQLKELSAETSRAAILEAGNRIVKGSAPIGPIVRFLINAIWGLATGYSDSITILNIGQRQLLEKQALFGGGDIFPGFAA